MANLMGPVTRVEQELMGSLDAAVGKIGDQVKDIRYLLDRAAKAGFMELGEGRDTGAASNSIVAIAYGVLPLDEQILPEDHADLDACFRMLDKLPAHRKTKDAHEAMFRAYQAVKRAGGTPAVRDFVRGNGEQPRI